MNNEQVSKQINEVSAELIALGWACAWLYYAQSERIAVREPWHVLQVEPAASRATESIRQNLGDPEWSPGPQEIEAVMEAVMSLMN